MTYKVIIVDDEPLARQVIRNYLKNYPDMEIISECKNGLEAVETINQFKPDIVFLDIQMPELSGLEVVERLDALSHIVFSTAYDEYAINAFEINAVDYLLKPYDEKRFGKTIQRLRRELNKGIPDLQRMISILETFHKGDRYLDRILIPDKEEIIFVSTGDILYIEAMENYISVITRDKAHLLFQKISDMEKKLNSKQFFRVHRSYIVNLTFIRKIETWTGAKYNIILENGKEIPLSRYRVKAFKQFFGM